MGESYNRFLTLIVVCLAVYVGLHHKDWLNKLNPERTTLPEHLLNHPVDFKEGLLSPETGAALMDLVLKAKTFPSNIAADLKTGGFQVQHEHIGEGRPIQADGTCSHPFLTPSPNRKVCYLPQRIDVGRHFILTGGPDGTRESFQEMLQRVTSFGRYYMGAEALENLSPVVKDLFNEPNFEKAAKSVCPADKQFLDPFQFNFIMQIPGQTVATHIDAPYFWGASRKLFPQWLLAVMVFSNLFKDNFIDQVQVVGYLSEYDTNNTDMGGDFIYYTDNSEGRGEYKSVPALHLAGSSVDGSKVAHASRIYQPKVKVPPMSKDKNSELVYTGAGDAWELQVDGETIANYKTSDLRISVVYRGRCFAHEDERDAYLDQTENTPGMDLEVVRVMFCSVLFLLFLFVMVSLSLCLFVSLSLCFFFVSLSPYLDVLLPACILSDHMTRHESV
jgi:hypothetical protein